MTFTERFSKWLSKMDPMVYEGFPTNVFRARLEDDGGRFITVLVPKSDGPPRITLTAPKPQRATSAKVVQIAPVEATRVQG